MLNCVFSQQASRAKTVSCCEHDCNVSVDERREISHVVSHDF